MTHSLGAGHNVVSTLILTRPETMTPVVARLGWPVGIAAPLVHPEQRGLVLAMSLGSGAAWMVFGALLVCSGSGCGTACAGVLQFVWVYQASLLVLMVLFVRFHVPAILVVISMLAALSVAIRHARTEGGPEAMCFCYCTLAQIAYALMDKLLPLKPQTQDFPSVDGPMWVNAAVVKLSSQPPPSTFFSPGQDATSPPPPL